MYIALVSFATKDYDIRRKQVLDDNFTNQDDIDEFLRIGYIENYVPGQKVDTADATAEADNIVLDKTAYARGQKLVGTFRGVVPTGTKEITENGTVDVTNYATANVNISGGSVDFGEIFNDAITGGSNANQGRMNGTNKIMKKFPASFTFHPTGTNMGYSFASQTELVEAPNIDMSSVTDMSNMFSGDNKLETLKDYNTTNVTSFANCLSGTKIVSSPNWDLSNAINVSTMFNSCTSLTTVKVYDLSKVTIINNMFIGCTSLTNTSLDNILQSCISATSLPSSDKNLAYLGFTATNYPAATIEALPHYQAFRAANWSIGY